MSGSKPITKVRYATKWIDGPKENPIFVVGACPGKQREGCKTNIVWEGNRSGDYLFDLVKNKSNVFMTNVFNWYVVGKVNPQIIKDGKEELKQEIIKRNPIRVICLGNLAFQTVKSIMDEVENARPFLSLYHPSYILRFNKDQKEYEDQIEAAFDV